MNENIRIAQLLCGHKDRHCIMAVAFNPSEKTNEDMTEALLSAVNELISSGTANPWCGICGNERSKWRVEIGATKFKTMKEAKPHLETEELKQLITRIALSNPERN